MQDKGKTRWLPLVLIAAFPLFPANGQERGAAAAATVEEANRALRGPSGVSRTARDTPGSGHRALLGRRAAAFRELMAADPRRALELKLSAEEARALVEQDPTATPLVEAEGTFRGQLETAVADDLAAGTAETRQWIRTAGETIDVFQPGDPDPDAAPPCGEAVVTGLKLGNRLVTAQPNSVTPIASCNDVTPIGEQSVAVILVKFPSTPTPTLTQALVREAFFDPAAPSLNDYWRENSYGKTRATGDVFGWFTLSREYSCDEAEALRAEAIQLADAAIDYKRFGRLFIIFPTPSTGCKYAGLGTLGCTSLTSPGDGEFFATSAWLSFNVSAPGSASRQGLALLASHEGGHNMGLGHATSRDFGVEAVGPMTQAGVASEYGDPFSAMGNGIGHYAAPHKVRLGWLAPGVDYQEVTGSGTFDIAPLASPSAGLKAIRVRRSDMHNWWLWVEFRQPVGSYDSQSPAQGFNGALIHAESAWYSSLRSNLLDFTPGSLTNDFSDSALPAGSTWIDPYTRLRIRAGSAGTNGLTVTVSSPPPCVTSLIPVSRSHGAGSETGTIAVSAPTNCNWTVLSGDPWVTITSAAAGTGPAAVSYRIDANTLPYARSGLISIGSVPFSITQTGINGAPVNLSFDPTWGGASLRNFDIKIGDPNGWEDIARVNAVIGTSPARSNACAFEYDTVSDRFTLFDDSGTSTAGQISLRAGTPDANGGFANDLGVGNSRCYIQAVSMRGSGSTLTLSAHVWFTGSFAGTKQTFLSATDRAGAGSGVSQMGSYTTVNSAPALTDSNMQADVTADGRFSVNARIEDANSYYDLKLARLEIGACVIEYDLWAKTVRLGNGSSWSAPAGDARAFTLFSSNCDAGSVSTWRPDAHSTVVSWNLRFRSTLAGRRTVRISAEDTAGAALPPQAIGSATVPDDPGPNGHGMTPNLLTGHTQTMDLHFHDQHGAGALRLLQATFTNTSPGPSVESCTVLINRENQTVRLTTGVSALLTSTTEIRDDWCILTPSDISASSSGTILTLRLKLRFRTGGEGTKQVRLSATDYSGRTSNLWTVGTWIVGSGNNRPITINTAPQGLRVKLDGVWHSAPVTMNWAEGSIHSIGTDTIGARTAWEWTKWSDGGAREHPILMTPSTGDLTAFFSRAHVVWVNASPSQGGAVSLTPVTPIRSGPGFAVAVAPDGATLQLVPVPAAGYRFVGWSYTDGRPGTQSSTDVPLFLQISAPHDVYANFASLTDSTAVISLAPNSGRGTAQTFSVSVSGKTSAANLSSVYLAFAQSPGSALLSCTLRYERAANRLWLNSDSGAETGPATPGTASTALRNQFCSVDPAATRVTVSGPALTVDAAVQFSIARARNVYARAIDTLGTDTGWVKAGTWATGESVTVDDIPVGGGPVITAPSAGQDLSTGGVTFSWNAVSGSSGYNMRIIQGSATVFEGNLNGGGSTSTLVSLGDGAYVFYVRSCTGGFADSNCGGFSAVPFSVTQARPSVAPSITAPSNGVAFTSSTHQFLWTPVAGALRYEILLRDMAAGGTTELSMANSGSPPPTNTIFSMHGSTNYRLEVRACTVACGPWSAPVNFSVTLPAVPSQAPAPSCGVSSNQVNCAWTNVQNADIYVVEAIQGGAGPGGSALTVANARVSGTSAVLTVPAGNLAILAKACNGNGCGPYSGAVNLASPGPNSNTPVLGNPVGGTIVDGPLVFFSWSRVPGDDGSNTVYRLYVQDFSLSRPALDILTRNNYWAARFRGGGNRYDALVIANPGPAQTVGPAAAFNVKGPDPASPTLVEPRHQDAGVPNAIPAAGNVQFSWTPVSNSGLYEYYVVKAGNPVPIGRGISPGLGVQIPLAGAGQYSGIVRACPAALSCSFNSDLNWGPWSNAPGGTGVTTFQVQ